jgi:hypothetical protein
MKKLITLLFFAGFLTTASFAQSGHHRQQNNTQSNSKESGSYQNSRDNHDYYSKNSRNGDHRDNIGNHRGEGQMNKDHSYRNRHRGGLFHRRFENRD